LVVRVHHRDEDGAGGDGLANVFRIDTTVSVDGQDREAHVLLPLELADGIEDGVVRDGGGHDVVALVAKRGDGPADRQVVCLGAAAGEDDLGGLRPNGGGHALACRVHQSARLPAFV